MNSKGPIEEVNIQPQTELQTEHEQMKIKRLKTEIEIMKDRLRTLKLIETYKKKWPISSLLENAKDWKGVARDSFTDLHSDLLNGFPTLTMAELAKSFTYDHELAHIENLDSTIEQTLYGEEDDDDD